MNRFVEFLLLSTVLPGSGAFVLSPGFSRSATKLAAAPKSKPKDRVFLDPTVSWASDLDQLEQLEKDLAVSSVNQHNEEHLRDLRHRHHESRKNMNEAQVQSILQDQKAKENEAKLREIRHRHYENRKHMTAGDGGDKSRKDFMYVYVDPTVAWASDLADLDALDAEEKKTQLRDLRHRHHEHRKNMV
jgi:hypothetical protein